MNRQVYDEFMSTGAVLAGRGTFEPADGWGGDHHDGVPIYILSRNPAPTWAAGWPTVHYVSDLDVAVRDAKHAAGDRNVLVHGAGITQRAIAAGSSTNSRSTSSRSCWARGGGSSTTSASRRASWRRIRVLEGEDGVTHLRYRVRR